MRRVFAASRAAEQEPTVYHERASLQRSTSICQRTSEMTSVSTATSEPGPASDNSASLCDGNGAGGGARDHLWIWPIAVLFAALRWWPLVQGHGLVGGDLYTYFFPLKSWYADCLDRGELPLWNPLIGHGMPALGESQTAVFYPFNLVLYRWLALNAAYNASFLTHYVLAFGFASMYLRRLGLGASGTIIGAMVFVYGWFPPRSCLEWAIVTGAWMPLVLWCIESYLRHPRMRYLVLAVAALAMQLLAGHFNLAFVTLLATLIYTPLRCVGLRMDRAAARSRLARIALFVGLGFGVASVQLLPTAELKVRSQRSGTAEHGHDVGYGNIPAWYLPQVFAPWRFYPAVDQPFLRDQFGRSNTNKVEAHLYFGLLPLALSAAGLWAGRHRGLVWAWVVLGCFGLALVTGWWASLLHDVPGFGYFTGPGRYGIMPQLAVAVLAGFGLECVVAGRRGRRLRAMLGFALIAATWCDLYWATDLVQYSRPVAISPISLGDRSPLAQLLDPTDRVVSRMPNSLTVCGVAMLPVYLGIGPVEYTRAPTKLPDEFQWNRPLSDDVLAWLRTAGVTHILATEQHADWPCELVWFGYDPMVHGLMGRHPSEPLLLYRLSLSLGRAYVVADPGAAAAPGDVANLVAQAVGIEQVKVGGNRAEVVVDLSSEADVVCTDLDYPGWTVAVDGRPAVAERRGVMFRGVRVPAGRHTVVWRYFPRSLSLGICVAAGSLLLVAVLGWKWREK